jgi:hypothetical protein
MSFEYWTFARDAGADPAAPNPLLVRLIRSMSADGAATAVRIGGNSADQTVADRRLRGVTGVRYVISKRWMAVLASVLRRARGRAILDLNLALRRPGVAGAEARLARRVLGPQLLAGLALGNEPDFYTHNRWARLRDGRLLQARGGGWTFARFRADFARAAAELPPGGPPLAGPDLGGKGWARWLVPFAHSAPRLRTLTVHAYAMTACHRGRHRRPTPAALLNDAGMRGMVRRLRPALDAGRRVRLPVRVGEGNTVACRGEPGVSDGMAAALWAPDALFRLVAAGAAGFDVHSSSSVYDPVVVGRERGGWVARVRPLLYGLLLFNRTVGPGARLLPLIGRRPKALRVWATRDIRATTRVLIVDTDPRRPGVVRVRLPGRAAHVTRLSRRPGTRAPTLGGRSFGVVSHDGRLHGSPHAARIRPRRGVFEVVVGPSSAALVTVSHKARR